MKRREKPTVYTPSATYRIQFSKSFTFEDAGKLVDYFHELGISDIYASPFLMARPGSTHGYDVTDHSKFNPEIGSEESFVALAEMLRERRMGIIADVVPNHMCISHPSNVWWWDVLENGPSSPFASFFDIDWQPPKEELVNKVLLPILGDQFGRVLENQDIQIVFQEGQFHAGVYGILLPLAPTTWTMILDPAAAMLRERLAADDEHVAELESINTAIGHLAGITETDEAKIRERQREREIVKRRLTGLVDASPAAGEAIRAAIAEINGRRGEPRSFDRLERLLKRQAYRLSFWRVAMDEINYRRFFDINDLAAIRVEEPVVFSAVHALIFDLVRRGYVRGLRVDHPDGLFEPEKYFRAVQEGCTSDGAAANDLSTRNAARKMFYVVAEKILTGHELLRTEWDVQGTTGYEFLNLLNGLFVDNSKHKAFEQLYRRFTGWSEAFDDLVCESKRLILQVAMSSELNVMARRLDRISEQHRWSRDFTLESLRDALREVLAAFPVYRTYTTSDQTEVDPRDRSQVGIAIREAKRRNAAISESVFDFIQNVLLLERPGGVDDAQQADRKMFVMRFQQLSSPVMAKGVEDTAFYRYYPLASLDEVGGDPSHFGASVNRFHRHNLVRAQLWPGSMSATSTHDAKRSEDVRARINVLSEMPGVWYDAIRKWRDLNHRAKTLVDGRPAPGPNEEYLLYQTLIGSWPLEPMSADEHQTYVGRIDAYMQKALHEAKVHTSWINPQAEYEQAVSSFIQRILEPSPGNRFLQQFSHFQAPIARAGMWNSLAQTLLKIAAPGVPDFYQGTETWAFDLVDPDNRRPVSYEIRRRILDRLCSQSDRERAALVDRLMENPCDGAVKMFITSQALRFRLDHAKLCSQGSYLGLAAEGDRSHNVVAFAREADTQVLMAFAGRFFVRLCSSDAKPTGDVWANTAVVLPRKMRHRNFRDVFTGKEINAQTREGRLVLPLPEVFAHCPVALLFAA